MSRKLDAWSKWRTMSFNSRFSLLTLLYAGYSIIMVAKVVVSIKNILLFEYVIMYIVFI